MQLKAEGKPHPEIRTFIDQNWGDQGPSTHTPLPSG